MTLFEPLRLREIEFKNRIGVSPMCQYSAKDGIREHGIWCIWAAGLWAARRW